MGFSLAIGEKAVWPPSLVVGREHRVRASRDPGGPGPRHHRSSALPLASGAAGGREPRPHTQVEVCRIRGAAATETRTCDIEIGVGFFKTYGSVLRTGVAMRYPVIQQYDRRYPIR